MGLKHILIPLCWCKPKSAFILH